MAGMQFEYDEKGGTFFYFLLSFLALVLFPATYYLWPRNEKKEDPEKAKKTCQCSPCLVKRQRVKEAAPWANFKKNAIKFTILLGWVAFVYVAYKTSQVELDWKEFDPFQELGIDRGASKKEIKKAYHQLSLIYHPDKVTGDSKRFMKITKAYQALTDEEAKKNWEEHGTPDGPGATHFGIALPKWIVEKQNSVWVLAAYGLVFMVILPVVVGTWWYRSIKYSAEQILMDTTQLYFYFFNKTSNMILKRVIMILGASMEFEKGHNSEVVERPSDNAEIPVLMRELTSLNEKNKERPLCYPYSVKARALLYAHFGRLELPPKTLELDKLYILKKCPYLVNEMVNIVAQLVALAHAGRVHHAPRLETIENCMKLSQMIIQAQWDNKNPMLQLPHITEDQLRHFVTKRRNVKTIKHFVTLKDEERRALLRNLSDEEYRDVMNVCASMPHVTMEVTSEVLDDEDNTITAGSIVTVTVRLHRENLDVLLEKEEMCDENGDPNVEDKNGEEEEQQEEVVSPDTPVKKTKVWEKQKKKGKGKGGKNKKRPPRQAYVRKPITVGPNNTGKEDDDSPLANGDTPTNKSKSERRQSVDNSSEGDSDSDKETDSENESSSEKQKDDDDEDWMRFQEESKKENVLETKSKETHLVHCPYFPGDKHEWWWVYIADRKSHVLITHPVQVCSLKETEEVQLKFSAPPKVGVYQYSVCLRSDSYLDFDQTQTIKLDVKEAKKIESHPQWDISDDEEDKDKNDSESDYSGDDSDDED